MGASLSALLHTPRGRAVLAAAVLVFLYSQRHKLLGVALFAVYTVFSTSLRHLLGRKRVPSWNARIEIFLDVLRYALSHLGPVELRKLQQAKVRAPLDAVVRPFHAKTARGYWIGSADVNDPNTVVLVYMHGGAFIIGAALENKLCYKGIVDAMQDLGRQCVVLTVEYSLAPEHPYPQGLNECVETVVHLIDEDHISPSRIFVGGDSAGGNLAVATALKLRDTQRPQPAALVLLSPMHSLAMDSPSFKRNARTDLVSTMFGQRGVAGYLADVNGVADEYVDQSKASLHGLAPAIVFNGGREILTDAITDLVRKFNSDNNSTTHATHILEPDMFHEWMLFPEVVPKEAKLAFRQIAEYMSRMSPHTDLV